MHSQQNYTFDPETYYKLDKNCFPWYFGSDLVDIEYIQEKPLIAAVLAGGQYGLVSLPTRARKYRCIYPHKESKVCSHVKTFENNEGASISEHTEALIQNGKVGSDIFEDLPEDDMLLNIREWFKCLSAQFIPSELQKDYFCLVSRFSTVKCPNHVFGEFF